VEEKVIINGEKKTVYYTFLTNIDFKRPKIYLKTYKNDGISKQDSECLKT
ncbi:hypothetical protein MetfoDRAFT_1264, partial [Methanotorris formicicus Mc-S-70]